MTCFLCDHPRDYKTAEGFVRHVFGHLPDNPNGGKECWCGKHIKGDRDFFVVHLWQAHGIWGFIKKDTNQEEAPAKVYDLYHQLMLGVTP